MKAPGHGCLAVMLPTSWESMVKNTMAIRLPHLVHDGVQLDGMTVTQKRCGCLVGLVMLPQVTQVSEFSPISSSQLLIHFCKCVK